jgi:general secretion pathway protein A
MYDKYYNLSALPFQLVPDAYFFFESDVHRQAMAYLAYGLRHPGGFIVITGEIGAGKTILMDYLLSTFDHRKFAIAKIVTTRLAGDDFLYLVANSFGIASEGLSKGPLLQKIIDFIIAQQRIGGRPVLVVDEAQHLTFEALEELRMLSNVVFDREFALQSLLLGQPQFRSILSQPSLEQLRQRVTGAYHLGTLNEFETRGYIEHRLRQAEWKGDPNFSEDCFSMIYQHTHGVPRRINSLCSRLLLHGFLEDLHTLTGQMVSKVAKDLKDENSVIMGYSEESRLRAEVTRKSGHSSVKAETLVDRTLARLGVRSNTGRQTHKFLRTGAWILSTAGSLAILSLIISSSAGTRPAALTTFPSFPLAYEPPPARTLPSAQWPEELSSAAKVTATVPRTYRSKVSQKETTRKAPPGAALKP